MYTQTHHPPFHCRTHALSSARRCAGSPVRRGIAGRIGLQVGSYNGVQEVGARSQVGIEDIINAH